MRSASNPGNIGHGWVKKRFMTNRKEGVVFIPSLLEDHPDKKYVENYRKNLGELGDVKRQQLEFGDWDVAAGLAYPELDSGTHFISTFEIPNHWERFESMDHGTTAPTSWGLYALDEDGNAIVADLYYKPNTLPDEDATEIIRRRTSFWERKDEQGWSIRHICYGDPSSIREKLAQKDEFGQPMTLQDLYERFGVKIIPANNRRRIGYLAIRQALKPDPTRRFPLWHPRSGEYGSPRLFIMADRCKPLIEQLQSAPLADGENDPERGEAIDLKWERHEGHASAMLRYGMATFQDPSAALAEPEPQTPDEIRNAYFKRQQDHMRENAGEEEAALIW